jgi:pre-mRNA-splicing factor CDC5/CEF1
VLLINNKIKKHFLIFLKSQVRENLKEQLGALPAPKNDYEIVVPEDETEMDTEDGMGASNRIADKDDIDRKAAAEAAAKRMEEFKKLCQAVQRNLPRPMDVNESSLRPPGMDLNDLQKVCNKINIEKILIILFLTQAEEMIKQEMVIMLHHDALVAPADNQLVSKKGQSSVYNEQKHFSFLEHNKYEEVTPDEINEVSYRDVNIL